MEMPNIKTAIAIMDKMIIVNELILEINIVKQNALPI